MLRLAAAIAAYIEVPSFFGGDDAEVLALGFRAFPDAARHSRFDLMRRAQAAVAFFDTDRVADAVVQSEPAPGAADATFDGAERLAICVTALEAGIDQLAPDQRKVGQMGAEHIDPLGAGDLGIEAIFLSNLPDGDQLLRCDLSTGDPRHYGISATFLDVGEEAVVAVL